MRTFVRLLSLFVLFYGANSFVPLSFSPHCASSLAATPEKEYEQQQHEATRLSRRSLFTRVGQQSTAISVAGILSLLTASTASVSATTTIDAPQVTDRIYIDVKGAALDPPQERIVIGLFGKEAPQATEMLKALVTPQGLNTPCKPREVRSLQKEQLEANKVYNACVEGQEQGVTYDLSTIWRVVKDERIDVGAVSGRFVARQFPNWQGSNELKHSEPGVVSVRKGNESGFGFVIYPGKGNSAEYLNENHLVVGRVLEGMNAVEQINNVPVVTSSFSGGPPMQLAPNRSCRYGGGQLYCNENKPLQKLSIVSTGIL